MVECDTVLSPIFDKDNTKNYARRKSGTYMKRVGRLASGHFSTACWLLILTNFTSRNLLAIDRRAACVLFVPFQRNAVRLNHAHHARHGKGRVKPHGVLNKTEYIFTIAA